MKYNKIFRTLALAIILSLLVIVIPASPALALTGMIAASPTSGPVGQTISVSGIGFTANQTYTVYFGGAPVTSGITSTTGTLTTIFSVPTKPRAYYIINVVTAFDTSNVLSFLVTPQITLSTSSGSVGSTVTVSGTGFAASKSVAITFDNVSVANAITTDAYGSFTSTTFTTPESFRGSHTVKATDANNYYATSIFTTMQSITITPTSGVVGDEVTISGTGFRASQSITITFDNANVGTTPTGTNGSFSANFNVPTGASGTHTVKASDGTYTGSASFTTSASFSLGQTTGHIGDEVTVSGVGFTANQPVAITFNNIQVKSITTDANGSFSGTFIVLASPSGTYQVAANDGVNTTTANFTILISATLTPDTSQAYPGYVGIELTISGIGFKPNGTVTVKYDTVQVATDTIEADGAFSVTFSAPTSQYGDHSIIASDGTNIEEFTFTMESEPPPIPKPLLPLMDTIIEEESPVYFDWEDVEDPSGVTYTLQVASDPVFTIIVVEKVGFTKSEYTLTEEERGTLVPIEDKEAVYYWMVKAIDGASNEGEWSGTGSFLIPRSGFTMPNWAIYVLFGVGALLFGVLGFWLGKRTIYRY